MDPVSDLRDTRVMIPRVRRALEGVAAGSGFNPSTYGDEAVNALVADSIANLLLYTGSFFGHQLEVTARDTMYSAPIAWRTSEELTEPEQALVALQAALDHVYVTLVSEKTSESFRKGDQEWSWTSSASVVGERLKSLRADRDRALEMLQSSQAMPEAYISFIEARDAQVSALIEPWVHGAGYGGQHIDTRGFQP